MRKWTEVREIVSTQKKSTWWIMKDLDYMTHPWQVKIDDILKSVTFFEHELAGTSFTDLDAGHDQSDLRSWIPCDNQYSLNNQHQSIEGIG